MHVGWRDLVAMALAGLIGGALALIDWGPKLSPSDWAAWVQAVGSILAIVASGGLAIWVPVHMRHIEERARVQRSINGLIILCGLTITAWGGLWKIVEDRQLGPGTKRVVAENIVSARSALAEVQITVLLGTAIGCMFQCTQALQTLEMATDLIDRDKNPYARAARVKFSEMLSDLEAAASKLEKMLPLRIDGLWMAYSSEDDLGQGFKIKW